MMKKETTIKDLVIVLLERANVIILVAIVGALILSIWAVSSGLSRTDSSDQLRNNESIVTMQDEVDLLNKKLEQKVEYIEKSVYFRLDGSDVGTKVIYALVNSDNEITPKLSVPTTSVDGSKGFELEYSNPTYDIASAYCATYKNDNIYTGINSIIGKALEPSYVYELVQMVPMNNNGLIQLTVYYDDLETAEKIAQFVFETMQQNIRTTVAEHELKIINESSSYTQNNSLLDFQTETFKSMTLLLEEIKQKELALNAKDVSSPSLYSTLVKKVLLFAVVGFLTGILISSVVLIFMSFFENKITSREVLERNYLIPVVGVVSKNQLDT